MRELPVSLRALILTVVLAGIGIGALVNARAPMPLLSLSALAVLAIWLVLVTVVDVSPLPLPRGGATASVSSILDFAAILVFGPALALLIALAAAVISRGVVRRDRWYKLLYNVGQIGVAVGAAGLVYVTLGGTVGPELSAQRAILPLLAAAVTYFLLNTVLVSLAVSLSEGLAWGRIWQSNFQWEMIYLVAFLPLGLLIALVQQKIGIWGVLLLFVQVLLVRYTFKLSMSLREANRGIVSVLATAIDANDPYMKGHSYRVSQYAVRVARAMKLPERTVELIQYSALLHDVGKIGIGHEILEKPESLSDAEAQKVRLHPTLGGEMLQRVEFLKDVEQIVTTHHERPDGRGYPLGLKDDDVPIGARIVGALDAYDAMTSDRPYRKALAPEVAMGELVRGAGAQFDETVVRTVKRLFDAGELALHDSERTATDTFYGIP